MSRFLDVLCSLIGYRGDDGEDADIDRLLTPDVAVTCWFAPTGNGGTAADGRRHRRN